MVSPHQQQQQRAQLCVTAAAPLGSNALKSALPRVSRNVIDAPKGMLTTKAPRC